MAYSKLISKTKWVRGFRCPKYFYLSLLRSEMEDPITVELQALFDQGNEVGEYARRFFPNGVLVDRPAWDFYGALAYTKELIAKKTPVIFEAAFEHAGCYARVDILVHEPNTDKYKIIEVKSSTKFKPEHIQDVGVQVWIASKSGLPLESIHLMHLNSECRFPDLENLFTTVDITDDIRDVYTTIQPNLNAFYKTLESSSPPDIDLGEYCLEPQPCTFKTFCFNEKKVPEISIFNLPKAREKKWEWYRSGQLELTDLQDDELTELQQRIVECHRTNTVYCDHHAICNALKTWIFPLVFLDFETINPAIPRYPNTGPYQHVPFQFSVHVLDSLDSELKHMEFLHGDESDPRPLLIEKLLAACGKKGSIPAYYATFERQQIEQLARDFPVFETDLLALTERLVDPLPLLREHYYDPAFQCSFSLKSVAPALLGDAYHYHHLAIKNGKEAQLAFDKLMKNSLSSEGKRKLANDLKQYCAMDTEALALLVKVLFRCNEKAKSV